MAYGCTPCRCNCSQLRHSWLQVEVSAIMEKIEQMAERMMVDLSDKHNKLHSNLDNITRAHENAIEDKVHSISKSIKEKHEEHDR